MRLIRTNYILELSPSARAVTRFTQVVRFALAIGTAEAIARVVTRFSQTAGFALPIGTDKAKFTRRDTIFPNVRIQTSFCYSWS